MPSIESTGKTIEEALESALSQLGVPPERVDVESSRARREAAVRELAGRVADRAKRNQERIGLEPMQPYERRVVHAALAEDPQLSTESEGEEPERRVVITPKDARSNAIVDYGRGRGPADRGHRFGRGGRRGFGGGRGRR